MKIEFITLSYEANINSCWGEKIYALNLHICDLILLLTTANNYYTAWMVVSESEMTNKLN